MVTLADVQAARERLLPVIHRTAMLPSRTFSDLSGLDVFMKSENLQKTGSFKLRGAFNRIATLTQEEKDRGVIASSAGNHAQGVAFGAAVHGVKATVVMPETAPVAKVMATQAYGAEVVLHGGIYDEAFRRAKELQAEHGYTFLHPFNDPAVIAGQGTIALEMLEDCPDMEAAVLPVGGGGLAAGVALALKSLKPGIKVYGVEAERFDSMRQSLEEGEILNVKGLPTLADGIAVKRPGDVTFGLLQTWLDGIVTVTEDEIAESILMLLERNKFVVEGAGAVGVAALMAGKLPLAPGTRTGVVLSGGNIDINVVSTIIEKGLVKAGRRIRVRTVVRDKPGQLSQLMDLLAGAQVNVMHVGHDRAGGDVEVGMVAIKLELETRNRHHADEVVEMMRQRGYRLV